MAGAVRAIGARRPARQECDEPMKQTSIRTMSAIFLVAASLLVATGPAAAHGEAATGPEHPSQVAFWNVDLAAMRGEIAQGNPVSLMLGITPQFLQLTELNVINGEKKIIFLDENENVIGEQAFDYWAFQGSVIGDSASSAFISMDDRGLYGFVETLGSRYNFLPADEEHVLAPGEPAAVRVKWNLAEVSQPVPQVESPVTTAGAVSTMSSQTAIVQPYADLRYRNAHSNYATRIANACGAQSHMWSLVSIVFTCNAPIGSINYSDSSNCGTHLDAFLNTHSHGDPTIDSWQLFTGKDLSCWGNAVVVYPAGNIVARNIRDSIVEAVDHHWWDAYDPDEVSDLGLTSGHEITHGWGEPDHPSNTSGGVYNIMATGVDPDNQGFWHTAGTQSRVTTATSGQF